MKNCWLNQSKKAIIINTQVFEFQILDHNFSFVIERTGGVQLDIGEFSWLFSVRLLVDDISINTDNSFVLVFDSALLNSDNRRFIGGNIFGVDAFIASVINWGTYVEPIAVGPEPDSWDSVTHITTVVTGGCHMNDTAPFGDLASWYDFHGERPFL